MSLLEELNNDIKQAMKDKNKDVLSVIRMVKSTVMNEQINLGHDLTKEEELTVLSREVKQRQDSLTEFEKGNREDLAAGIRAELAILAKYLPEPLSDEKVIELVKDAIQKTGATSPKDMGKVMAIVTLQVKGKADGKFVANQVKNLLKG
ncbi:GatB/YqeY domain-containing protein [Leuconostoc mesenteroides]|uniref:GatB/YqeY domain-containing protein n=1 Tax=Leuconostoc mesenteroides TaxID=1245 RepID=UPI000B9D5A7A|nr:GatB/YqeY domain-containing protein [Leuconostoc mesenteroides]MBZ1509005.1 GatB/YqeY domain-containing protein [Leuconostoc mesenteroides]MBZ1531226.1 GatB/YqeY domain-containing protein [Leuconostoc mesenteroides]MBZ1533555.1 GatB/YqeY domain-containing protein [Leuconostoc mesenteroides]MCT8386099.1 GatB/YqeY domain-containing protein [Leuconostoc mesenteroides]QAR69332.1 GatB/YqeY domain-containing protein [Leuconostoc mesenteroides]